MLNYNDNDDDDMMLNLTKFDAHFNTLFHILIYLYKYKKRKNITYSTINGLFFKWHKRSKTVYNININR